MHSLVAVKPEKGSAGTCVCISTQKQSGCLVHPNCTRPALTSARHCCSCLAFLPFPSFLKHSTLHANVEVVFFGFDLVSVHSNWYARGLLAPWTEVGFGLCYKEHLRIAQYFSKRLSRCSQRQLWGNIFSCWHALFLNYTAVYFIGGVIDG